METRRARPLLGTLVDIRIAGLDKAGAAVAIEAAFGEIAAVHRLMSFHETDSDVSRLNRDAWRRPVAIAERTVEVIELAVRFAAESHECFDPTVAAQLVDRGFLPRPPASKSPARDATWRDIEIVDRRHVRFARPLWLDLGGIAKGYAVDRAIDCLRSQRATTACVNAGGDLRRIGAGTEPIHIRDPAAPQQLIPMLELGEGAIATSGSYFSRQMSRHRLAGPHIDGSTRRPADAVDTVSVLADTCVVADALTKIMMVDPIRAEMLLATHDAEAVYSAHGGWRRTGRAA